MTNTQGGPSIEVIEKNAFALRGAGMDYRFHVDGETSDLRTDHFGGSVDSVPTGARDRIQGWSGKLQRARREFPDLGRGDFRSPAFQIRSAAGHTVSQFKYSEHKILNGKERSDALPGLLAEKGEAQTLLVTLVDEIGKVEAELKYSVFPEYDAVARSVKLTNRGDAPITVEKLASFSVDLIEEELDLIELHGDWAREGKRLRRKVDFGTQGFGSTTGYSSHIHNPFLALAEPTTTESQGEAWGFSLIYTGSFNVEVEKSTQGATRALIGLHPAQLSWEIAAGESFTSPECVAVYSSAGIGGMSRKFHKLYRKHLVASKFASMPRPVLLNAWEGVYFNFDAAAMVKMAKETAALGIKLLVMDDGWFGKKYPRVADNAGLGDWVVNPDRFPDGLDSMVDEITKMDVKGSSEKLKFGLWVEPEMLNPKSELYDNHPDWVLHAGDYPRTEQRNQLVLNLALKEVQDYIIDALSKILESANITYIKWDNNRGMHETSSPNASHEYMLGLYRVLHQLTTKFPDVLWEGCASGGGRFDPGILQYFPQSWTSDDTDALERIKIQFGTSLVYPASSMGAHVSAVPNHVTGRITPLTFRAHVAMMGGSFGFELDPAELTKEEQEAIPGLVALADRINPTIITGDMYRLRLPEDTDFPAMQYVSEDGKQVVLFCFQMRANINSWWPQVKLQGLDAGAKYKIEGGDEASGRTLMNLGLKYSYSGEFDSKVVLMERV